MPDSATAVAVSPAPIPSKYLIDKILRANEPSLISGPSGSGKSTLLLQILSDWQAGRDVFSHPIRQVPFMLMSCDRPMFALEDTMERMEIDPTSIPRMSILDERRDRFDNSAGESEYTISELISIAKKRVHGCGLIFMDGFAALCPNKIIDHRDVRVFLQETARLCRDHRITILGTVYAAKARNGEGYSSPRERMLGSGAWSAFTSTKFVIELEEAKRVIHILPQNSAPELWELMHDPANGRLIPFDPLLAMPAPAKSSLRTGLDTWLQQLSPGSSFTTSDAQLIGESFKISKRTVTRWIADQESMQTIFRVDHGEYRVTGTFTTI
jgi:hypothetical protein